MKGPAAAFVVALLLYIATLAPDVHWGDSAQLQTRAAAPVFSVRARGYPLFTAAASGAARILPVSPAVAANLVAAFAGALATGFAFALVRRLANSTPAAAGGAAALAVSHLVWSSSAVAEVYSLAALLLVLLLLAADEIRAGRPRGAVFLGLTTGVSLLHHRMVTLAAGALVLALIPALLRERRLGRTIRGAALGFAVGVLPFALILAAQLAERPGGVSVARLLFGAESFQTEAVGVERSLLGIALYEARFLAWNLAGPQILFAALGAAVLLRSARGKLADPAAFAAVGVVLTAALPLGDGYLLLLPAIVAAAVLAGVGLGAPLLSRRGPVVAWALAAAFAAIPTAVYAAAAASDAVRSAGFLRDVPPLAARTFLWPGKSGRTEARRTAEAVFDRLPEGAEVVADWEVYAVLRYLSVAENRRPDVTIFHRADRGRPPVRPDVPRFSVQSPLRRPPAGAADPSLLRPVSPGRAQDE